MNGSHGNPEVVLLASSKMTLAVLLQVFRDRRAGGLLQLLWAKDVGRIAWPVVGNNHASNATLVTKMQGRHVGEWGQTRGVEQHILKA
jgi:hypothetical protein